jgi:nucleoside-diphosphate-sugar epimerase
MHGTVDIKRQKQCFVDVRSVALAHLNAIKIPEAANQRFMLINGDYWMKDFMIALSKEFPDWPIKTEESGDEVAYQEWDTKLSEEVLKIDYEKDIGKVLIEMAHSMIATGALKKPA